MLVERERGGGRGIVMAPVARETGVVSSSDMRAVLKYQFPCVSGSRQKSFLLFSQFDVSNQVFSPDSSAYANV